MQMRKTSRTLGIIGSSLAVVGGLSLILVAALMGSLFSQLNGYGSPSDFPADEFGSIFDTLFSVYYVIGGFCLAAAIPGFIAVAIVTRKNTTAGVLNIVAAVLSCVSVPSLVLFILAAVFAYKQEKPPVAPQIMYAPYAPGVYPPPYGAAPGAYPPPPYGTAPGVYPPPPYGTAPGAYPPPYGAAPGAYPPPAPAAAPPEPGPSKEA
jgi:hypothetical protein